MQMISNHTYSKKNSMITTQGLKQGLEYKIDNDFVLNDHGLYYVTKDKNTGQYMRERIAGVMFISDTSHNLDEELVCVKLTYKQHDNYYETKVKKVQLAIPNELVKLNNIGAEIPYENRNLLVTFFRKQEKTVDYKEVYTRVGFHMNKEKEWNFYHNVVIPKQEEKTVYDEEAGALQLTPKGSLKEWTKMIKEEVEGHTPLEFILAVGFSAPLVGYLSQSIKLTDTMFIHINGPSTGGKTTACMLAVSPFGDPNPKSDKSLTQSWSSTENSIIENLNGNRGIPIVLDELSMNKSKELSAMFYAIAGGKGKGRLTDQMSQRKKATWSTTILSNGEISAFLRSNENAGIKVRVKEINGAEWTKSAENADKIKQVITNNYGKAGVEFVEYLFQEGLTRVEDLWRESLAQLIESLPKSEYTNRIAKDYAVIIAAATLANEALDLSLDVGKIMSLIVLQEKEASLGRNTGRIAYEKIKQILIENQANFRQEGNGYNPLKCWGKILYHRDYIEFAVLSDVMEQQLKNIGFENMNTVLKDWDKDKLLHTEGDRKSRRTLVFTKEEQELRRQIMGSKASKKNEDTTYNLKIPKEELEGLINKRPTLEGFVNYKEIESDLFD